ncbi:MAG: MFS transporter [Acidimicrobiales bacterium]
MSRRRQIELMILTAWAMTAGTFQLFVGVVLAANLIDEFDINRWEIGVLGAVNTGVGALVAPRLGRVADRLGVRRSMVAVNLVSALGFLMTSLAFSYWVLLAASVVAGVPQGASNSVTNKVIADEVPPGMQGSVTGVKQSGVQFAVFLSGAILPPAAATIGWRPALAAMAVVTAAIAVVTHFRFAPDRMTATGADREVDRSAAGVTRLDPLVRQVALYALLLGMTAGGMTRFYPLFAHEVLGYSETTAGLAVSIAGLVAIAARVIWGRLVDDVIAARPALLLLALGSAVSAGLLLAAQSVGAWLLWPTVVIIAFTVVAWNVVAMLTVIRQVPRTMSGRATGVVLLGFLGGLTLSAPLVGYSVDRFGSYRPAWTSLLVLALLGAVVVARRPERTSARQVGSGRVRRSRRILPREVRGRAERSSS